MSCIKGIFKNNYISLRVITVIFKVLALAPFTLTIRKSPSIHKNNRIIVNISNSYYGSLYNIVISLVSVVVIPYFFYYYTDNNPALIKVNSPRLEKLYLIIVNIGIPCMSTVTVIFFYIKRKILVSIISKIIYVSNELKENICVSDQRQDNTYQVLLVLLQIALIIVINIRIFQQNHRISLYYYTATGFILESLLIQYALLVDFLRKLVIRLNESLLSLANKVGEPSDEYLHLNNNLHYDIIKKFIFIRKMHRSVYETTQELSDFYSFPILFAIISSFLGIIINIFMTIYYHGIKSTDSNFRNSVAAYVDSSWTFKDFFPILALSCYTTKTVTELKRTDIINQRVKRTYFGFSRIRSEMEQFSMELLHRQYTCFNASYFFSIDSTLLISIFSTTITYMIVLLNSFI